MEQSEEKRLNRRIDTLENDIKETNKKIEKVDDKLGIIDDKHDDRHLKMQIELIELKGASEATAKYTEQMAGSIDNLVIELREVNGNNNERFLEVDKEVKSVRDKVESNEKEREFKLAEKTLSNKTIGAIILASAGVIQIIINVLGPMLFS